MLHLTRADLRVDVLDPVANVDRLGPRFCWGGYVWQVHDRTLGPLLAGPEWPSPEPAAFNGQGLPESFRHRTLEGRPLTWRGERGVALGAGELALGLDAKPAVVRPCAWDVSAQAGQLVFTTEQEAAGFHYQLTRSLELDARTLRSATRLTNASRERLTLEWFAHPFFPLLDGLASAELSAGSTLAENPGFTLVDRTLTQRRRFVRQDDGHMDRGLRLPAGRPLVASIAHPQIGRVEMATSFAPDACVIWANDRTFSLEPYLTLDLAPGETRGWHLSYRF